MHKRPRRQGEDRNGSQPENDCALKPCCLYQGVLHAMLAAEIASSLAPARFMFRLGRIPALNSSCTGKTDTRANGHEEIHVVNGRCYRSAVSV